MTTSPALIFCLENDDAFIFQFKAAMEVVNPTFQIGFFPNGNSLLVGLYELDQSHSLLPNLILLNDEMPQNNGIAIMREIKKIEKYREVPVLILMPDLGSKRKTEAIATGAKAVLSKPISDSEIKEMVKRLDEYWAKLFNQL